MARLIPAFMDERTPPGEREVFNLLAAGPEDWVALHSLDLAPWNRGLRTEIDFVLIVPDAGILCVEVKSQENITFDGRSWYPPTIVRSPLKQAADGRFTLHRRLSELVPDFTHIPVGHCCIFPCSPFDVPRNLSVQPWELMDARSFRSFTSGSAFCADLRTRLQRTIEADNRLRPLVHRLPPEKVDSIVVACVPVQKRHPTARDEIVRRAEEIENLLREQQKPVLQLADWNQRLIVSGPAGTGKTLIASEVALRAAEKGRRVALLCYNQLVGDWLKQSIERSRPALPNLIVGRAIRVMAELTATTIPDNPSREFWESALPDKLEECLTNPDFRASAHFDYLVLDEAQDLLARPRLWECLTQFLRNGQTGRSFALFGDFEYQVLTDREPMQRLLALLDTSDQPVHWRLTENCRNYRIVGDTAVRLSGLSGSVYSAYTRTGGAVHNYDIYFYEHEQAQLDKLVQWLRDFKAQGYKPSEITILSFRADERSAAWRLKNTGYKLRPAWQAGELTGFASVQAFKGLENKVIILTDVVLGAHDFQRDLFYTGMTRSTESVRILCDKECRETLFRWLTGAP